MYGQLSITGAPPYKPYGSHSTPPFLVWEVQFSQSTWLKVKLKLVNLEVQFIPPKLCTVFKSSALIHKGFRRLLLNCMLTL